MRGNRVAPVAPAKWAVYSLIAVLISAAIVQFVPFVWLTAPAAGVLVWIGGSALASLLLGNHQRGRVFHGVLGLVLGIVVMLIVGLFLHYSGRGISHTEVAGTMSFVCAAMVLAAVVFRREAIGAGFLPMRDVIAAVLAATVLVLAGSIAVAIQDRPVEQFEVLSFTDPAVASSIEERQVDAGAQVFVSWELHSFGYEVKQVPWSQIRLGDDQTTKVDVTSVPSVADSDSGFRGSARVRAPETPGAARIEVTVRFVGPTGEPIERQVFMAVYVR
ncbi:MAG TPA: hypothetical protein PLQ19_01070 [Aeromicrobium sp.]|nr:hypothetical protein [Aeromicrobium sp.]